MDRLADLLEKRGAIVARMNAAHTADDGEAFSTAETELRALDARIARARSLDAADRADPGTRITGTTDEQLSRELRSFSLVRFLAGNLPGSTVDWGREREMQPELAKRAGKPSLGIGYVPTEIFEVRAPALTTDATQQAILPTDYRPELFTSALVNEAAIIAMGATQLTGLTGDVEIPREVGSPPVGWVNENEALSYGNATFDSLKLTPHHVGALSEFTRQMLMQTSPGIEQLTRQMLARNISLEIDRAAIAGAGTGAQPKGLLNDTNVPTVAFETDLFTTTAKMIALADVNNTAANRGFLSTNGVRGDLLRQRDADGRAIPVAESFHNEPHRFTNQAPANRGAGGNEHGVVYGDWRDLLVGIWSQLDILINPYAQAAFEKGNVLIRAMATVDFGVRRPKSFVAATGVKLGA